MQSNRGFVLITVVLVSAVLLILVLGASFTALLDRQVSASQRNSSKAYYVAKAGVERLKAGTLNVLADAYEEDSTGTFCASPLADRLDIGDGIVLEAGEPPVDVTFGPDHYEVDYNVQGDLIFLRSTGVAGPARSTVQVVATVGSGPANVWDNAIYTERIEPASGKVAGTISAYGSVHIVEGEVDLSEDLELSGSAGIYNNYEGSGRSNDQLRVSDEAQNVFFDSAMRSQDLCTRVKIHRGNLEVGKTNSGAGTRLGAPNNTSEDENPNAIHGIYLGDGNLLSNGDPIEATPENNVYSRNDVGDYSAYEGDQLPSLPNPYPPDGAHAISDPALCPWIQSSGGTLEFVLPPSNGATECSDDDGQLVMTWDGSSNTVNIEIPADTDTGRPPVIAIPHDFRVASTTYYRGEAAFYFGDDSNEADVNINGSFLAEGEYLQGSAVSLVTNGDTTLDVSSSDLDYGNDPVLAAMVMAKGVVAVNKQIAVFGTLVGSEVQTKAVPSVAHNRMVATVANRFCLPGTNCETEGDLETKGLFVDLSEERR